jgi:hypothetical protein
MARPGSGGTRDGKAGTIQRLSLRKVFLVFQDANALHVMRFGRMQSCGIVDPQITPSQQRSRSLLQLHVCYELSLRLIATDSAGPACFSQNSDLVNFLSPGNYFCDR